MGLCTLVKTEIGAVGTASESKIVKKERGTTCSLLLHVLVKLVSSSDY